MQTDYSMRNLQDLDTVATEFVSVLKPGDRIGLSGPLGAGKTTFTQRVAAGLGIKSLVDSPTFTLRQSYPITNHPSFKRLVHIDLYRLSEGTNNLASFDELGLIDDWNDRETLVMIEWIDRFPSLVQSLTYYCTFDVDYRSNGRRLSITQLEHA